MNKDELLPTDLSVLSVDDELALLGKLCGLFEYLMGEPGGAVQERKRILEYLVARYWPKGHTLRLPDYLRSDQ